VKVKSSKLAEVEMMCGQRHYTMVSVDFSSVSLLKLVASYT